MKRGATGYYIESAVRDEVVQAFVPNALPPKPPLKMTEELQELNSEATLALGRLDGLTAILPDTSLFLYMYIRKEAVLSSQIEGTQSSLSELLLFEREEMPGIPTSDVIEISNYVAAMKHGLTKLKEGLPLSSRLIREIHSVLLSSGRGSSSEPGEFRRSQNWIGGTRPGNARFVPPPHTHVMECMGDLENFFHNIPRRTPTLIKAAMGHVQFETIHPFLDGDGRVGRLLITFLLCSEAILSEPMLYLSLYFKSHREEYYDLLQRVRTEGIWEEWIAFFLSGVKQTSDQAISTAQRLIGLLKRDRALVETTPKQSKSLLRVFNYLTENPITTASSVASHIDVSFPTANSALKSLQGLGIVKELTGRSQNRIFAYQEYLDILNEGAEPL